MGNCVRPPSSTPTPTPNATPHPFSPATHSPLTQTTPQVCEIQMEPFITYIDGLFKGSYARSEASEFINGHIDFAAKTIENISNEAEKFKTDFASNESEKSGDKGHGGARASPLDCNGVTFSIAAFVLERRMEQVSSSISLR
eukprot:Gb_13263 [translate_table: standard]